MRTLSLAVFGAIAAMATAGATPASAEWVENCWTVHYQGTGQTYKTGCKKVWVASQKEIDSKLRAKQRQDAMTLEMSKEAAAYARMKADRQKAPTKEHCQMVNGNLECKPAP